MSTEKKTPISDLLGISMEKVKEMADVNAIIGDPIKLDDGTVIIPVSKVTYGFASGGSDLPSRYEKNLFGGGAGAGISINPEGFLVISPDGTARMVQMTSGNDPISNALNTVPNIIDKVKGIMDRKKGAVSGDDSEPSVVLND